MPIISHLRTASDAMNDHGGVRKVAGIETITSSFSLVVIGKSDLSRSISMSPIEALSREYDEAFNQNDVEAVAEALQ
jgi:hypothetical protein